MKATFTEWSQIHWSVLALVLATQLLIWIAFSTVTPFHKGVPFVILGCLCFMSFLLLAMKIDMVYTTLKERPEIWASPEKSRYDQAEDDKHIAHVAEEHDRLGGKDPIQEFEIEMDLLENEDHHSRDFHLRVHESSSDSETDTDHHRNTRKRDAYRRRTSKPAFAHYSSSSSDSPDSSASWVSTWSSSSSWVSIRDPNDPENTIKRQHHHHHHHHHHHAHHSQHHHQSDLQWVSGFLIPLIRCKFTKQDVVDYFTRSPHQKEFWLGSPGLYLYLCHLSTFWQATVIGLLFGAAFRFLTIPWYCILIVAILSLINLLVFFPHIVYQYSFCMNVGEYSKHEFIREVGERPSRKSKETKEATYSSEYNSDMNDSSTPSTPLSSRRTSPRTTPRTLAYNSMSDLRDKQEENLQKILPTHPRIKQIGRLKEDSLATLVNQTPEHTAYSTSTSSSE